jgi:membrane protease YdiL (CAAX protease family)
VLGVALFILILGGVALARAYPACDLSFTNASRACGPAFVLSSLLNEVGLLAAVLFWVRAVKRAPIGALGLPGQPFRDLRFGALGGMALYVVSFIAGIIILLVGQAILGHPPSQPDQIPDSVQQGSFLWSGVVVVIAAPIGEETFFRGFLYRGLRRRFSVWPAVLISSAAFALIHGAPILILALFPVGIGLALIYERRQSLVASIAAHAVFNLIGIVVISATR